MSDRRLMKLTAAAAITMVFYLPLASYYPLMSSTYFKASAWHGSAVEFLYALGMMVSAIIFGSLGKVNNKLKASYLGLAGSGITCFICGILPSGYVGLVCFCSDLHVHGRGQWQRLQYSIRGLSAGRPYLQKPRDGPSPLLGSIIVLSYAVGLLISSPVAQNFRGKYVVFGIGESVFWLWWLYAGFPGETIKGRLIFVRKNRLPGRCKTSAMVPMRF